METGGAVLDHVSRDAGVLVHKSDVVDSGHVCVCVRERWGGVLGDRGRCPGSCEL